MTGHTNPPPPSHIADWTEVDPEQYLTPQEAAIIDEAHAWLQAQDFVPLTVEALTAIHLETEMMVAAFAAKGMYRSPLAAAFHLVMITEAAPIPVRDALLDTFTPIVEQRLNYVVQEH